MLRIVQRRLQALLACIILLTLALALPAPTQAQTGQRCFPETGFCISGNFRIYWERNGGLAVFGYPISAARNEVVEGAWVGPTQWFERDRLEDHSAEGAGVLAGRLGAQYLERVGRPWQRGPGASTYPSNPDCRTFFPETGYQVCGGFRTYWEQNGGLARFGYPITEPIEEQLEGKTYTVQYFERRRMEQHPELPGNPVLLGLLSRTVYSTDGPQPVEQPAANDIPAATQQAILDAAYTAMRAIYPREKVAIGLVEVTDNRAVALARTFGGEGRTVALSNRRGGWEVVLATETPGGNSYAIIEAALAQLQDARGSGLNAYVTRPRIAGNWARTSFAPALSANRDGASAFYQRVDNTWRFVTAGTAFPEDQLRQMGVPVELWPYGESVRGPNA